MSSLSTIVSVDHRIRNDFMYRFWRIVDFFGAARAPFLHFFNCLFGYPTFEITRYALPSTVIGSKAKVRGTPQDP